MKTKLKREISIITPVLNGEKFIEENILSIRKLSGNVEHIIVDGGSTDKTLEIVRKYASDVILINQEGNSGMYSAIDQGIKISNGEYITWVNCDDRVVPESYSKMIKFAFRKNADFVFSHGYLFYLSLQKKKIARTTRLSKFFLRRGIFPFLQPSTIYKRSFYDKVLGFDFSYRIVGDVVLFHKMAYDNTARFSYFNEPTTIFIKYGSSLGDLNSERATKERSLACIPDHTLFNRILFKMARLLRI